MTMTSAQINKILEKAVWSPSGDNCQPWTFEWDGKTLGIIHKAGRAGHVLNPKETASMLSLGCLLTALDLAASDFQFNISFVLENTFQQVESLWAKVQFHPSERRQNPLSESLLERTTDRRLYKGGELTSEMLQAIIREKQLFFPAQLHTVSNSNQTLINYVVEAEQLLLDHPDILPATLEWVRFTLNHARKTCDGMFWQNMEIRAWELPMVPILRDIPYALNVMGPLIRPQNRLRVRRQLESAAGLVCISIPAQNLSNSVHAGRLMMSVWLALNKQGYGVQPFTIASTIAYCARHSLIQLPQKWIEFFRKGENILRQEFSIPLGQEAIWLIRTGLSSPLPEKLHTFRKPISEILRDRS